MTKLFSSGGTKDIGPQHQRGGGGPQSRGPSARVSTYKAKPTGFAAFKASVKAAPKAAAKQPVREADEGFQTFPQPTVAAKPAVQFDSSGADDARQAEQDKQQRIAKAQQDQENARQREADQREEQERQLKAQQDKNKKEQEREDRERLEREGKTGTDYTSLLGVEGAGQERTALLTGGLKAQFDALNMASGPARGGYDYTKDSTPQNPAEALLFLSQATQSRANNIYTMDITEEMFRSAEHGLQQGDIKAGTKEGNWAQSLVDTYRTEGPTMYILDGRPLSRAADADLIGDYTNIQNFKMSSLNMIEGERAMRQDFVYGAVAHGQDIALQSSANYGHAEAARIAAAGGAEQTRISAQSQERQQATAGRQEQEAITAGGREARLTARTTGEQERLTAVTRGEQERLGITAAGTEESRVQKERGALQMEQLNAELEARREEVTTLGQQKMAQIDREMSGQQEMLNIQQSGEQELLETRQAWQASESDKDRAIAKGDAAEVRRATMVQEGIKRDEMDLVRDQNNITNLMTIAANPAMLYHMREAGMLGGIIGNSIGGQDLGTLLDDLTAGIDPGKPLPNIQDFNAMSQYMQDIESWQMGASRGMSPEGAQDYIQATSPFSRGGRSEIRVGRGGSRPFREGRI